MEGGGFLGKIILDSEKNEEGKPYINTDSSEKKTSC